MNQKEIEASFVSAEVLLFIHSPKIGDQVKQVHRPVALRLLYSASASDSISANVFFLPLAIHSSNSSSKK
jgi:hypothetical protein